MLLLLINNEKGMVHNTVSTTKSKDTDSNCGLPSLIIDPMMEKAADIETKAVIHSNK